jgi:ABC-type iron transport system FetAB ATPase subunit
MKEKPEACESAKYLICDSRHPLTSGSILLDEFILHALDKGARDAVCEEFNHLTGKEIGENSRIDVLSGGQKVLLMALLALYSPAPGILFIGLEQALDESNRNGINRLLEIFRTVKDICCTEGA